MAGGPTALGRPAGAVGEQTRLRIIDAAMRCVAEVGYSRASIREIARAAGMTSGSLYHYFPNKADLLKATDDEIERIVLPRLRAAAARSDDITDRLEAVLDESRLLNRDHPSLATFLRARRAQGSTRLRHTGPSYPGSKALRVVVTEIVEDARAHGALLSETSVTAAVDAICALTRGLSEQAARLPADAYAATLDSAKQLLRGTLFATPTASA
ncbi:TetR/AcrR family transcriptional regulator [Mycobacterium vicinigordonae]|uniref:TetR/AcrR family transcriptional regulator n=1 Tax=Mycobacterium vicinigordonae TaxID=1719132 RepID=A0A7D6I923_9MYCO|nr:TetR/AcrR family transcriptional regulator [Mycobacterium vicinigordonae]QLL07697.1 TetR/AcrR family transcriptional regulator [Mycobacterium vicinigordonae]